MANDSFMEAFRDIRHRARLAEWQRREVQVHPMEAFELQKFCVARGWYPTSEELAGLLRAYAMRQLLLQEEWRVHRSAK